MSALGMAEVPTPDRFLIALAVLELLSDAAELTSMLIVVDDAQWLDRSSGDVLAFVARRIEHEPIVMLVASRDGGENYFDDAGLPELRLWGLDGTAAEALLAARAPDLTPAVRERMLEVAGGNLLALVELPVSLGTQEVVGHSPLPLTERLEWAFASRVAGLPPSTQTLLLLAAADDDGLPGEILAAAAKIDGTGFTAEDFAPAIDAELVRDRPCADLLPPPAHAFGRLPAGDARRTARGARRMGHGAYRPSRPPDVAQCRRDRRP